MERFDVLSLPSKGLFYKNNCSKVKVFSLVLPDEEIMTSPNLINNGLVIDTLLERKVTSADNEPFVPPSKMLLGDRLALIVYLRCTMDNIYKINLYDGNVSEPYEFDLTSLKLKDIEAIPNKDGEFDFFLQKEKKNITFRLMIGEDEQAIFKAIKNSGGRLNLAKAPRLEKLITSVEGETNPEYIRKFVSTMNIKDGNQLLKYMDEVTPGFDLNITAEHPKTKRIVTQQLEFGFDFFFPSI